MKVIPFLTLALALLVPPAMPVAAQDAGNHRPPPGGLSKGPYTVLEDGTLIYEDDIALTCEDLPKLVGEPELPTAKRAFEACARAGFPPPGTGGPTLPQTGGPSLPVPGVTLPVAGLGLRASG